jgi:hypothetical protein
LKASHTDCIADQVAVVVQPSVYLNPSLDKKAIEVSQSDHSTQSMKVNEFGQLVVIVKGLFAKASHSSQSAIHCSII